MTPHEKTLAYIDLPLCPASYRALGPQYYCNGLMAFSNKS
jgi:hypothetical protein